MRWIGPPDAEEPAPQVTLTGAGEEASEDADEEEDDDGPSTGLVIAALVLGGLGLVTGTAGLMAARRRGTS